MIGRRLFAGRTRRPEMRARKGRFRMSHARARASMVDCSGLAIFRFCSYLSPSRF